MAAAEAEKPQEQPDPLAISDEEIDAVIAEAKGDVREAIRMSGSGRCVNVRSWRTTDV